MYTHNLLKQMVRKAIVVRLSLAFDVERYLRVYNTFHNLLKQMVRKAIVVRLSLAFDVERYLKVHNVYP